MFKLENLTEEDVKIIGNALVQLPYGVVAPLIDKINSQLLEQTQRESLDQ